MARPVASTISAGITVASSSVRTSTHRNDARRTGTTTVGEACTYGEDDAGADDDPETLNTRSPEGS